MRSPKGLVASLLLLAALPVAFAAQAVSDGAAELVIHAVIGGGCLMLAAAALDFGLSPWLAWIGRLSAATFGAIFLLQATSQVIPNEALRYVAFDLLGQELENLMPYITMVWFVAVLTVGASRGLTRIVGWTLMSIVLGVEFAAVVGPAVGIHVDSLKILFLLPFIWLLIESIKRRPASGSSAPAATLDLVGGAAS